MTNYQQTANPNATNSELDAKVIVKVPDLNSLQLDEVREQYAEIVLDRMDYKDLEQYVYDSLTDYYGKMTQNELKEHINEMEDDLGNEDNMFDELVDNVTQQYPKQLNEFEKERQDTSPYDKIPERY